MRVLVVDDNRDDLQQVERALAGESEIEITLCDRPDRALTLITKGELDCLILDIHMPAMDGLQMIQQVRDLQGDSWLPTIFMTGILDAKSRGRSLRAGGDAVLTKPIESEVLIGQLRAMQRLVEAQRGLKEAKDHLEQVARRDRLTGILNRRGIDQELNQAISLSWRFNTPMSLLLIDVDRFKGYNELHGHLAGDEVLRKIGNSLVDCMQRQSDVLGRFGGEEFILGLPATDQAGANAVADRVLESLRQLDLKTDSNPAGIVTASVGVATLIPAGGSMDVNRRSFELMQVADQAMYEAKGAGGNTRRSATCSEMNV
ncbi:MAG: GGDEF domain-containing protein [Litorivicinus sp.]